MSRYIVLREQNSSETLMIDKATLRVTRLDADAAAALDLPDPGKTPEAGFSGMTFAFAVEYRSKAPARMLYREELPLAS